MSTIRPDQCDVSSVDPSSTPKALGRSLRMVAGPKLRPTRRWTALAAFLCGGAGAIPFAIESHAASASSADVASLSVASLLDAPSNATPAVAKLLKPGMDPNAKPDPAAKPAPAVERANEPRRSESTRDAKRTSTAVEARASERASAEKPAKAAVESAKPEPQSVHASEAKSKPDSTKPQSMKLDRESTREFNGRPVRAVRTVTMRVTAYSPDERSCGASADGITASGYSVWTNGGRMVAADSAVLPLGSLVSVPGYDAGGVVPVLDRGGAIRGHRLDLLFPTHEEAKRWGVRDVKVTIYEYADGKPNDFRENHARKRGA